MAASGGWLDGHTLRADVIFLETPYQMDITCSLPRRTAEALWRHPPLTPAPTAVRWQFIRERLRDSRQMSAGRTFYLVNSVNLWFVGLRA